MSHLTVATLALQTLDQHQIDPHQLLRRLHRLKTNQSYLDEQTQTRWIFIARQRSRLFLLAKPDDTITAYQDVLSISLT